MTFLKRKIIVVTRELTLGGAAFLAVRYVNRLSSFFDIDFLITGRTEPGMLNLLAKEIKVYQLNPPAVGRPLDALDCLDLVSKEEQPAVFQRNYDVALAISIFPDWNASLAFSRIGAIRKLTFLVDESLLHYPYLPAAQSSCMEVAIRSTDVFLPVSFKLWKKMAASAPALRDRPLRVVKPMIEVSSDQNIPIPIKKDLVSVLTVARLSAEKQVLESLYIHHDLVKKGLQFRWYVIGSGPQEKLLREEIARLEMEDLFVLLGPMENSRVFAWMRSCDVFALLSSSEGCPTVVMEALAMCRPVIATDVNGVDELITNGLTGRIVANSTQDIAEGLETLITDKKLRDSFTQYLEVNPVQKEFMKDLEWLVDEMNKPVEQKEKVPVVSILIPAFNHEISISRAISSALMQDFKHLEVVVVDDASSDRTEDLARLWEHNPRFRYIRNDTNLGRVKNYRHALESCAQSEWVLMLDGDDYLTDPGFVSKALSQAGETSCDSLMMIQAGHQVLFESGEKESVDILPDFSEPSRLMPGGEYLNFVYETGFFTHLGTLFRRQQALDLGCYTADISSTDMEGLLRLAMEGEVLLINSIAGCWVQHGKNASSNLDFNDVLANVRLFRTLAHYANERGHISMQKINPALTVYEANTLASLFFSTLANKPISPITLWRMVKIAYQVNPRLLLQRKIQASLYRYGKKSIRYLLQTKLAKTGRQ